MQFFWTFYLLKNPDKKIKMYHNFHKDIKKHNFQH